jgi:hypothetical protein
MSLRSFVAVLGLVLCLHAAATAAVNPIENPAAKIRNPADTISNPASHINNPASNNYNPATRMDNPDPLSPPTQAVPQPALTEAAPAAKPAITPKKHPQPQPKPAFPRKSYSLNTAGAYIHAAKKAFIRDDYREFLALTEDALRRISSGTLKASRKEKQKLVAFKAFGYGLLKENKAP